MKLWIGVTDNDWFRFLRSQSGVEEVNFWQPGGRSTFKALKPGELFLFKLHYPENFIGGGFFVHSTRLPYYGDPVLVRPRLGQGTFRVLGRPAPEQVHEDIGQRSLHAMYSSLPG